MITIIYLKVPIHGNQYTKKEVPVLLNLATPPKEPIPKNQVCRNQQT